MKTNYPTLSPKDLQIIDLKRENDAAFDEIVRLSKMIVDLGYDPTQSPINDPSVNLGISDVSIGDDQHT